MQMDRERRYTIANGECSYQYSSFCNDYRETVDREKSPALPPSSLPAPGYIEHLVSKFDTLAGVAIKYGVEVADIKKINGLSTDLQMFALKTLQIPLPGRHPPSPCLSNGSETPGEHIANRSPLPFDLFDSFQSLRLKTPKKVSPAMSSLQGYYGLRSTEEKTASEGFEMAVYGKGGGFIEDPSTASAQPLSCHRKSRSLANVFADEYDELADHRLVGEASEPDKLNEKLLRRRQKSEADFTARTPEMLLENNTSMGGFSSITGKGLALRSKAGSRTSLADAEFSGSNVVPVGIGDHVVLDGTSGVRKSSSTSSLQDQDGSTLSSIWQTSKWNLKPDLQALSNVGIARPIFDGLPKPITGRKNKAAID